MLAAANGSGICCKITGVNAVRVSWLTTVGICALAAILLALNGYTGYSITVALVGVAAAVNLF